MDDHAPFPWPATTPYTRFIVLSGPRTGSNMLTEILNRHPDVRCFRELFNMQVPIDYAVPGYDGSDVDDLALRETDGPAFLAKRIFVRDGGADRSIGFKFHYSHSFSSPGVLKALVADRDLRVVHLQRRNALRTLVSLRLAERSGRWMEHRPTRLGQITSRLSPTRWAARLAHARRMAASLGASGSVFSSPGPQGNAILLTAGECEQYFAEQEFRSRNFKDNLFAQHSVVEVEYEDLVSRREAAMAPIWQFLGVREFSGSRLSLRRQNPEPLETLVKNYDELKRHFAGTPFESYFAEGA